MTLAFESVAEARAWLYEQRACGLRIGFVPTMGALHEGHLDLVRRAARENDLAIVSVFVNPLQFNDPKDYAAYPRTFAEDVRLLATAGCAMAFTGTLAQFFPHELDAAGKLNAAHQVPPGAAALGLEGAMRPGHFEGVAAIVDRLFETVLPDTAYFGAKDYQQAQVVLGLARRRGGPRVVVCPTVREASGLALSSRNARLSVEDRQRAAQIYQALNAPQVLVGTWRACQRHPAGAALDEAHVVVAMQRIAAVWEQLFPAEQQRLTRLLIERVQLHEGGMDILWREDGWIGLGPDIDRHPLVEEARESEQEAMA